MRLTAPQRALMEMDNRLRDLERQAQDNPEALTQYYIALLRAGQLNLDSMKTAAVLGNSEARKAIESLGEDVPVISEPSDILNMFGLTRDELLYIFNHLHRALRGIPQQGSGFMRPGDEAAWVAGRLSEGDYDPGSADNIYAATTALNNINAQVGMKRILEILQFALVPQEILRAVTDR